MSWLTAAAVAEYGQSGVPASDPVLVATVAATAAWIERRRPELVDAAPGDVDADVALGARMLAWRWFQRRASPLGTAGYGEFGAGGMLRHDPDIAKLLGIGADGPLIFGAGGRRRQDPTWAGDGPALATPPARGWLVG